MKVSINIHLLSILLRSVIILLFFNTAESSDTKKCSWSDTTMNDITNGIKDINDNINIGNNSNIISDSILINKIDTIKMYSNPEGKPEDLLGSKRFSSMLALAMTVIGFLAAILGLGKDKYSNSLNKTILRFGKYHFKWFDLLLIGLCIGIILTIIEMILRVFIAKELSGWAYQVFVIDWILTFFLLVIVLIYYIAKFHIEKLLLKLNNLKNNSPQTNNDSKGNKELP